MLPRGRIRLQLVGASVVGGVIGTLSCLAGADVRWAAVLTIVYLIAGVLYTRRILESGFLLKLFVAGYLLRILLAFVLYLVYQPDGHIFPDDLYYMRTGLTVLESWQAGQFLDLNMYHLAAQSRNWGYSLYNALHYLLAPSHLLPMISNAFLGTLIGVGVYRLAREVFDEQLARVSAILAIFHSGLVWFSAVNLKDTFVALMVVSTLLFCVRSVKYQGPRNLIKAGASAIVLFTLRFYMAPVVIAFIGLYWVVRRRMRPVRKILLVLGLVVGVIGAGMFLPGVEKTIRGLKDEGGIIPYIMVYSEKSLGRVQGKETTILGGLDQLDLPGVLLSGLRFILNPNPFNLHDITWLLLPGMLLWYFLLPFFVTGGLSLIRHRPAAAVLLVGFVASGFVLYALLPNLTSFRHRLQFLPAIVIISAYGLGHRWRHQVGVSAAIWSGLAIGLIALKLSGSGVP